MAPARRLVAIGSSGATETGVHAGQANRRHPFTDERGDQVRVRGPGKHGHDGVERGRIGDAQSFDLPRGDLPACELRVDRAAAAVHHDEPPRRTHVARKPRDAMTVVGLLDELAAELEHERPHRRPVRSSTP